MKVCECCNVVMSPSRNSKGRFCSIKCQQAISFGWRFIKFLAGAADACRDPRSRKRMLVERDGYVCSECGISEWNGKEIVLEMEHKDGNSDNNSPDNLTLLCPNCHSQTDTFKSKNIGNGRHSRRVRYSEGKSF